MTESQSRYGIMEELNNRKINQREKLANLEREKDTHVFEEEKKIQTVEEETNAKEKTYKIEFKDRQQQRKVNLQMITSDYERAKKQLEEGMKDDKDNYEKRFQEWKKLQNEKKELLKIDLARYNTVLDKKIKDKTEVIKEIESGISSLKEISKEQQAKD